MQKLSTVCNGKSTGHPEMKSKFILLHPQDNILVCCRAADAGEIITVDRESLVLMQAVELGHKVARQVICKGDRIAKYGVSIGAALRDISPGEHIHLHNMKSNYISPHTRERLHEVSDYK